MIAITGGGTGGHLVIAKAIKEELNSRGMKPIYIGSTFGQDQAWFKHDAGFEKTYFIESQGIVNKKGLHKVLALCSILRSAFRCRAIFKDHHIKYVFSVGGYSAAPASFGAIICGIPLYIHEQNAIQGKLNTLLRPFSKVFFSSYDKKAKLTNYPVSEAFFQIKRERKTLQTIIFLGGSQGASFINTLAQKLAPLLHKKGIAIIHQTGQKEFEAMKIFYAQEGITADVFDFSKDISAKLTMADFAISRSGASTLWELCAASVPALFIPFPHAAANHQYFNAKILADQKLALILTQNSKINPTILLEQIQQINLLQISQHLSKMIQKGGAKEIVDVILQN